ncbi:hypothetical protein EYF80_023133 [Liparis tanakae]|uniref:Uncharacterized protein n=1 Tax=Liparis tanakae TaxID=230148 RepID=A0A4Z2HL30_9TELE|nr:hypothetical protein EYF80_023133 [Liparis tanakae]
MSSSRLAALALGAELGLCRARNTVPPPSSPSEEERLLLTQSTRSSSPQRHSSSTGNPHRHLSVSPTAPWLTLLLLLLLLLLFCVLYEFMCPGQREWAQDGELLGLRAAHLPIIN